MLDSAIHSHPLKWSRNSHTRESPLKDLGELAKDRTPDGKSKLAWHIGFVTVETDARPLTGNQLGHLRPGRHFERRPIWDACSRIEPEVQRLDEVFEILCIDLRLRWGLLRTLESGGSSVACRRGRVVCSASE